MGKKGEYKPEDFKYKDCYHQDQVSGKRTKWIRYDIEKIDEFRNQYNNYNVFATVQSYRNKSRQEGGEVQYAPLYFDLDSNRGLVRSGEHKGLVELGLLKAEHLVNLLPAEYIAHISNFEIGIPITGDICQKINAVNNETLKDLVWRKNMEITRQDAIKLTTFFISHFSMSEDEVRVFFSGGKGFHVLVEPIVLGIQPDKSLNKVFKYVALYLESSLGLLCLDSASIYGHSRMLRLPNSIHQKSGKFKVEITHAELHGDLNYIIDKLATRPRDPLYYTADVELSINTAAYEWFMKKAQEWQEAEKAKSEKQSYVKDKILSEMEGIPTCIQFILNRGILKSGDRNKATMALASYYKDIGTPEGEAIRLLADWVKNIPSQLTSSSPSEVQSSTITCVKTVYQDTKYHFQCAFVRSLHGDRQGKNYEAVPCAGRICPAHEDYAINAEPAQFMHLAKTANAEFTGKKVAFNALVSGKLDTPYIVPKIVRFLCRTEDSCDKDCIMHDYSGLMDKEFHENERFLVEACNQNDQNLKGILRHHSRAACNKIQADTIEHINVSEILVVPMADRIKSVKTSDGNHVEVDDSGNEYVTRKVYGIGNEILSNQYYKVEGYVYSHPKNAMATVLSQKHEPLEDTVSQFKLLPEMKDSFKVFQKASGETIDDRLDVIVNDLVQNVTLVYDRFEAHVALLLTYHSCLNYYFQDQLEKRGWLETVFVGDSGQAKTQLVSNVMEFAGIGNMASGEGSSRTGLIYRLEQMGERWFLTWGRYPLSDRKLMAIDEFGELPAEDFGKITEARTTGVLRVDRAKNAETNARVRLILLTNPAHKKTLKEFTHGVESLKYLFASPADIRRLDLAVFLKSGDVSKTVLNAERKPTETQLITSEVLRQSILWAWSRKASDITIEPDAMKQILKRADYLGEKYGYAQDIPILEPSDLRKKLARMSIALAILIHSTDDTHEKVIVTVEHVAYIVELLELIYDNSNARLDLYSLKSKEETELTAAERAAIRKKLDDLDFADHAGVSTEILDLFKKNDVLKPAEIIDMLGYERNQINTRLAILTKHTMITRTKNGLRKLPKFIEYLDE